MSIEIPPTIRMLAAILDHFETYFTEAGCPLTPEQAEAMQEARRGLDRALETAAA